MIVHLFEYKSNFHGIEKTSSQQKVSQKFILMIALFYLRFNHRRIISKLYIKLYSSES